jgi:glycosyltransferase involved in cell wall biosynthesis
VLYVISTTTGGTPQTNEDLMRALEDRITPFVLRCDAKTIELSVYSDGEYQPLEQVSLADGIEPLQHRSAEYDTTVSNWLAYYAIDLVHVRHIAWHSLSLTQICKELDIRVVFSFHDFYTVCPTVKLLDERLVHCGGKCTPTEGQCVHELWPQSLPPLKRDWIHTWRSMMKQMLAHCDAFVTTSQSSLNLHLSTFPWLASKTFLMIPHGRQFAEFARVGHVPSGTERIRLLVPGNISDAKGADVIRRIAELDAPRRFQFHILGNYKRTLEGHPNIVAHGPYERDGFLDRVRGIDPHFGAIFSVWPETYCHTLTEMWACGLPVIALEFGAVAERIRATGGGWLVQTTDPEAIYKRLLEITADGADTEARISAVGRIQEEMRTGGGLAEMADSYYALYKRLGLRPGAPVSAC